MFSTLAPRPELTVASTVGQIDEMGRLEALARLDVLGTDAEGLFDSFTSIASQAFAAPIALISLVTADTQWFKSCIGLDVEGTPRSIAFCDYAIREDRVLVVLDATADPRFADNPLVTGDPKVRFYAGAPLTTRNGHKIGTLCIIDQKPRQRFSEADAHLLQSIANGVMQALELRTEARASKQLAGVASDRHRLLVLAENMAKVGTWSWDVATDTTYWSAEVYNIHGCDPHRPPPSLDGVLSLYDPDSAALLSRCVQRAVSEGLDYHLKAKVMRPDGLVRDVVARGTTRRSATGAVEALMGTFQDVTHLRLADAALRASEVRYRRLADNANDIVSEASLDGRFTYVSPAVASITGYSPEEAIGTKVLDFVHPDDRSRVRAEITRALTTDPGSKIEHRHICKDGRTIWIESRPTLALDPITGEPFAVTDVLRDITSRKALEAESLAAREAAEAAAVVKSEFMANMSHELRTPLTSILGFSRLLEPRVKGDPEGERYIEHIAVAGRALLATVNDILDFSKLEAGQVEIEPRVVELAAAFQSVVDLLAPQAEAARIALTLECDPLLPGRVMLDDVRLGQVMLNLLSNAVKFSAGGDVQIRVAPSADAARIRCEVQDTGVGIPPDRIDRLFKRFSQVDASTTRLHGGTGLGLAISHGLVTAMGGEIGVDSVYGQGSTFWFELPLVTSDEAPQREPVRSEGDAIGDFADVDLLAVDDNPANLELVRIVCQAVGIAVTAAQSGAEAISIADNKCFDVILMDLRMPGLDGHASAKKIKSSAGASAMAPILAFSADATSNDLPVEWRDVFDGQVAKPLSAGKLLESIQIVLAPNSRPF